MAQIVFLWIFKDCIGNIPTSGILVRQARW